MEIIIKGKAKEGKSILARKIGEHLLALGATVSINDDDPPDRTMPANSPTLLSNLPKVQITVKSWVRGNKDGKEES